MNTVAQLRGEFSQRYGDLLWSLSKLEVGWHSFEAVWSDDGGRTTLTGQFTLRNREVELRSCSREHIEQLFLQIRGSAGASDSEQG
jgi:hypothetical protein